MKKLYMTVVLLVAFAVTLCVSPAWAKADEWADVDEPEATAAPVEQQEAGIAAGVQVSLEHSAGLDTGSLLDGGYDSFVSFDAGDSLVMSATQGDAIGGIYVRWYAVPGSWTLSYTDVQGMPHQQSCGQDGFLHEYVPLEGGGATSCELTFPEGASACTLDAYGVGAPPASVQTWSAPCTQADFLVCSTHADDEILWLGGVLATYAGGQKLATQVVYMTNYWNGDVRREHEKLDGLWTIGVRNYPVNAPFEDIYAETLEYAQEVYDQSSVTEFFTEQVRRFKPLVVVCQDFGGEYGHGGHQVLALAVQGAVDNAADATYYPESAQTYGVWDTPKTYYHLYDENRITLDLRQPIANLGGMTAVEAAETAYRQHTSQQWTWFYVSDDPGDPLAEQVNCSEFGLYRSTVGPDTGNDMLEHVTPYEQQATQAQQPANEAQEDEDSAEATPTPQPAESSEVVEEESAETGLRIPIYAIALAIALVIVVVSLFVLLITH